jgi:hypothetical protein
LDRDVLDAIVLLVVLAGDQRRDVELQPLQVEAKATAGNFGLHSRAEIVDVDWHGVRQLPASARAGRHHLADLSLAHPGQLADMAAGLCDVPSRHGFCRIIGELLGAICRS